MRITIQWQETHYYCEEVEVPDGLDMDGVDDWVAENFLECVWAEANPEISTKSEIEWTNP